MARRERDGEARYVRDGPGGYEAVLVDGDGAEVARVSFFLRDPDAASSSRRTGRRMRPGEPIDVRWADGPANRWDWLGVFEAVASDPEKDSYSIWAYTGQHASGTVPPSTDGAVSLGPTRRAGRGRCRPVTTSCTTCWPTSTTRPAARASPLPAAADGRNRRGSLRAFLDSPS